MPVGAVITLADDGGGGTISTTTSTGNGTGGSGSGGGGGSGSVPQATQDFLGTLPTTATSTISTQSTAPTVRFANSMVTFSDSSYAFTSAPTSDGYFVSTNNQLLVAQSDELDSDIRLLAFYVGENLGTATQSFSSTALLPIVPSALEETTQNQRPRSVISYAGNYQASTLPTGSDLSTGLFTGTFDIDVNFDLPTNAISGTANDGTAQSGTFSGGTFALDGDEIIFSPLAFAGVGSLDNISGDLSAEFFGSYGNDIIASGALSDGSTNATFGLAGASVAENILQGIRTTSTTQQSNTANTARGFQLTSASTLRLAGRTYTFDSQTSSNGMLIDNDNGIAVLKAEEQQPYGHFQAKQIHHLPATTFAV